jgi:hypothetical protein
MKILKEIHVCEQIDPFSETFEYIRAVELGYNEQIFQSQLVILLHKSTRL